jgi:hypothetical protein
MMRPLLNCRLEPIAPAGAPRTPASLDYVVTSKRRDVQLWVGSKPGVVRGFKPTVVADLYNI